MSVFEIADSNYGRLRTNLDAPLPLSYDNAVRRALELRATTSLSYNGIAAVMRQYHGVNRSVTWWKGELRAHGAEARPRGIMCCGTERVAA